MKEYELKNAMEKIEMSDEMQHKILEKAKRVSKRTGGNYMKSKKKISIAAIAATFILCITVFSAKVIVTNWFSSSSSNPNYRVLPTQQQCIEDIGYAPVLIEAFENGYKFQSGNVVKNNLTDENGHSVEKFKSVSFNYEKKGDRVYFSQEKFDSEIGTDGDVIATVGNIDISYYSYINKIVPPHYKMTSEDKKAEKNGDLVFSWGSSEVEICKVQSVSWFKDGIHCQLMQIDGQLSADELADMAKEAIR